jgi:large subunit ribosomal protein L5
MQRDDRLEETTDESATAEFTDSANSDSNKGKARSASMVTVRVSPMLNKFRETVIPTMMSDFGYKNVMQVPRLTKAVINVGVGDAKDDARAMEMAQSDITMIAGQKPVTTRAKISVAGFKLREGMPIGTMVTLRRHKMYDFLDKLMNAALPRVRDFRGVSDRGFDGHGNYTLGIQEQIIFPEVDYGEVGRIRGLQISIVTTAKTDEEGHKLLEHLGMPFAKPL